MTKNKLKKYIGCLRTLIFDTKSMTTKNLLPCPFCGSLNVRMDKMCLRVNPEENCFYGECQGCGAQGAPRFKINHAKKIWNTRSPIKQEEK